MIHRSLQINTEICIKNWPSEYDASTLKIWLESNCYSIVVVMNPSKKDYQYLEKFMDGKLCKCVGITIWVVTEKNPKKEFNIDNFGVVLDFTTEKNRLICKDSLEEVLDNKLSAFLTEPDNRYEN